MACKIWRRNSFVASGKQEAKLRPCVSLQVLVLGSVYVGKCCCMHAWLSAFEEPKLGLTTWLNFPRYLQKSETPSKTESTKSFRNVNGARTLPRQWPLSQISICTVCGRRCTQRSAWRLTWEPTEAHLFIKTEDSVIRKAYLIAVTITEQISTSYRLQTVAIDIKVHDADCSDWPGTVMTDINM